MSVSVITTVKNGASYIVETLENIKLQTFKDFEHIIIDDGSTDNTPEVINKFIKDNPSYVLHLFQPGALGRGKALNYALSKARYKWIAIIDSDDMWHPQKLEKQMAIVKRFNSIDLLTTKTSLYYDDFEGLQFDQISGIGKLKYFSLKDFFTTNHINHSSVLIRKDICKYDEKRSSQFDLDLWLRLLREKRIVVESDLLLSYRRIHENQSFEGKMKRLYRWRSYKLKMFYCLLYCNVYGICYNTLKLCFDLVLSRSTRLKIRSKIIK